MYAVDSAVIVNGGGITKGPTPWRIMNVAVNLTVLVVVAMAVVYLVGFGLFGMGSTSAGPGQDDSIQGEIVPAEGP